MLILGKGHDRSTPPLLLQLCMFLHRSIIVAISKPIIDFSIYWFGIYAGDREDSVTRVHQAILGRIQQRNVDYQYYLAYSNLRDS